MVAVHEEHLRRPRTVGLAAKLLVALGFGLALLLFGGQAAHAADGPLSTLTHRVTGTAEKATSHVVRVSASTRAERTARVLPYDDAEVASVALQPHQVEVTAPALARPAVPLRVVVPTLLPSLPRVEVSTVAAHTVRHLPTEARSGARATTPLAAKHTPIARHAVATRSHHLPAHIAPTPRHQPARPPLDDRPTGDVPTGAAPASSLALAVLGTLGLRAPAHTAHPVHTVDRRVPVAPSFEPSFTPD